MRKLFPCFLTWQVSIAVIFPSTAKRSNVAFSSANYSGQCPKRATIQVGASVPLYIDVKYSYQSDVHHILRRAYHSFPHC